MRVEVRPHPGPALVQPQRRRHLRMPFSVPFSVHYLIGGNVRISRGITLDISEGGLGALVPGDLQIGGTVAIDLPLQESGLSTVAIVRHYASMRSGFEFLGLTPEEQSQIVGMVGYS